MLESIYIASNMTSLLDSCVSSSCLSFWFSFVNYVLVYRFAYVFLWLCLDVPVVHVVSLCVGHESHYTDSSTHWVAPQDTLGPLIL